MENKVTTRHGFTIVELLIVIVVIAILAAVTIVGYIGVSQRATESMLKSEVRSAAQQIELYKTENGSNPASLSDARVTVRQEVSADYRNVESAYCVSFAQKKLIYSVDSRSGTLTAGGCVLLGGVSTFAGTGASGANDGAGSTATFGRPFGIAVAANGDVYATESMNRIRKITTDGMVTTITPSSPILATAIHVGGDGLIYVAEGTAHRISKVAQNGEVTVIAGMYNTSGSTNGNGSAARFNNPYGITSDDNGNLYIADAGNHRIRKVTPNGDVTTIAGTGTAGFVNGDALTTARFSRPYGITIDPQGNLYVGDTNNSVVRKITPAGTVSTFANVQVAGLDYAADGSIYAVAYNLHTIVKINPAGVVTTVAGTGIAGFNDGVGTAALFSAPNDIAVSPLGTMYVADLNNYRIRKIE